MAANLRALLIECARELERLATMVLEEGNETARQILRANAAEKRLAIAREALDWYADIDNYSKRTGAPYDHGLDQGRRARQALAACSPDGGEKE